MQNLVNVRDFSGSVQEGDWAPAFADAIAVAAADGRGGVFVPADTDAYTVAKPGPQRPSIDLRGARDFMLVGEGPGSVIQMAGSGGGGSWHMIHIGGHAANITVRDLFLDGNRSGLDQLDTQTHLIKLGGSNKISGGADNVKIHNCTLTRSFGDGIAILPTAGDLDDNADEKVSNVQIAFCSFIDNNRSGISNQRSTDLIEILYNYFEGNSDQDIDFEPTGGILGSGPRRYIILGNTILHSKPTTCVTLSGVSGDIPASDNIFAYNQLHGGRLGLVDAEFTSIVGNFIVGGPTDPGAVVRLTGKVEGVRLAGNHIVRPAGALPGQLLAVSSAPAELTFESTREPPAGSDVDVTDDELTFANHGLATGAGPARMTTSGTLPSGLSAATDYWVIRVDADVLKLAATRADADAGISVDIADVGAGTHTLTLVYFPRGLDVHDNRFHTHVGSGPENSAISFTNAQECSFRDNEVHSYHNGDVLGAVKFDTTAAGPDPARGWDISGNRFRGDAGQDEPGEFTNGLIIAPDAVGVEGIRVTDNSFGGCRNQIFWNAGTGGAYRTIPMAIGNNGTGVPHTMASGADLPAILIGGNGGAQPAEGLLVPTTTALYSGIGSPEFSAALSSIYMRTDGSPGELLYVNTDGATAWSPFA